MESDKELIELFHSKMLAILKDTEQHRDIDRVIKQIRQQAQALISDRTMQEHRCFFAFAQFLYNSYGEQYSTLEDFLDEIKCRIGWARIRRAEHDVNGVKVKTVKYKPKSLSFSKCSRKDFREVFERIQLFAFNTWGVMFDQWFNEYSVGASQ